MVVVEGVARSLNPNMNIWQVASPVVTDYIQKSIGPRAVVSDLYKTARVLTRFGPRKQSIAYKLYRKACGRDERVKQLWGAGAPFVSG